MAPQQQAAGNLFDAQTALTRAAALAGTPDVVLVERDIGVLNALTGSRPRSHKLIRRLADAGRLRPVRRGVYVLVDNAGTVAADIFDLIEALTPRPYLITAGRALQFHGLTDQHFRRIDVLVETQLRQWSWRGTMVKYANTTTSLRGFSTRTRKTPALIANPERAVADSLDRPALGVTLSQVAEALDLLLHQDSASLDRLAVLTANAYGHALARRLGFLATTLAGDNAARVFLPLVGKSTGATALLAGGPADGPVDPTWMVRVNVDPALLLQHRERH
jgi:predicted transcriptional regulator of viral defense system